MTVTLRTMHPSDLPACHALTQKLGWSHRLEDWQEALLLGHGIVAIVEGNVVGSILHWCWGSKTATIGLVIVDDGFQGQGIGKRLMLATLEKLDGYSVRLHATEMGKGLYARLGFVAVGNIHQYQTSSFAGLPSYTQPSALACRKATEEDFPCLVEMEKSASGMERSRLISHLHENHRLFVVTSASGKILGFAARRRFGRGWSIGPVVAENVECAQKLITMHLRSLDGQFVRIDTASDVLKEWLESAGFADVDAPVTMIKGNTPTPEHANVQTFALMTQAMA